MFAIKYFLKDVETVYLDEQRKWLQDYHAKNVHWLTPQETEQEIQKRLDEARNSLPSGYKYYDKGEKNMKFPYARFLLEYWMQQKELILRIAVMRYYARIKDGQNGFLEE
jgi:hypothetical protein